MAKKKAKKKVAKKKPAKKKKGDKKISHKEKFLHAYARRNFSLSLIYHCEPDLSRRSNLVILGITGIASSFAPLTPRNNLKECCLFYLLLLFIVKKPDCAINPVVTRFNKNFSLAVSSYTFNYFRRSYF